MNRFFQGRAWLPALGLAAALYHPEPASGCGVTLSEPKSHFENVDFQGHLHLIENLGHITVGGKKKEIPIYLIFNSGHRILPPYLGAFDIPLLTSRIEQTDENSFLLRSPTGWQLPFRRNSQDRTVLDGSDGMKGVIDERGDTITAWADCGDKLVFSKGRLIEWQTKDAKLNFVYSGARVSEIREGGKVVLKVNFDEATGALEEISTDLGRSVKFGWGTKPVVKSANGLPLVHGLENALTKIHFPDGTERSFEFGVNEKVFPTVKIDGTQEIVWNPEGDIVSDGDWIYSLKKNPDPRENAAIERVNSLGQKESWHYDGPKGQETIKLASGATIVTKKISKIGTRGDAVRSKEILNASGKSVLNYRAAYDEKGNLIRQTFNEKQYSFDESGQIQAVTLGEETVFDARTSNLEEQIYGETERPSLAEINQTTKP